MATTSHTKAMPLMGYESTRQQPKPKPRFSLAWFFLIFFILLFLALMIWPAVVIGINAPSIVYPANQSCVGNYIVFSNSAAEPYSGPPSSVLTGVTSSKICQDNCNSSSTCLGFTHDISNSKCYLYNNSTLPLQNNQAIVTGKTQVNANVFIKTSGRVIEFRGIM